MKDPRFSSEEEIKLKREKFLKIRKEALERISQACMHETVRIVNLEGGIHSYSVVTRVPGGFLYMQERKSWDNVVSFSPPIFVKESEI